MEKVSGLRVCWHWQVELHNRATFDHSARCRALGFEHALDNAMRRLRNMISEKVPASARYTVSAQKSLKNTGTQLGYGYGSLF